MYWIKEMQSAIGFIEDRLTEELNIEEIAHSANSSYDLLFYGIEDKHYTIEGNRLVPTSHPFYWEGSYTFYNLDRDRSFIAMSVS